MEQNYNELYLRFAKFERDNSLFDLQIDDVYVWDRIRTPLYVGMKEKLGKLSTNSHSAGHVSSDMPSIIYKGINILSTILSSLTKMKAVPVDTDVLFHATNTSRRQYINGSYWDVLVDPLSDELCLSNYTIESYSQINSCSKNPVRTSSILNQDILKLGFGVMKLIREYEPLNDDQKSHLHNINQEFSKEFSVNVNITERVRTELIRRHFRKPIIDKLLDWVHPSALLIRYNPSKSTWIESAQERDIPVVEIQHGTDGVNKTEISYPFAIDGELTFPDVYFSWGQRWKQMPDFPIKDVRAVGWPFLSKMKKLFNPETQPSESILFISQPTSADRLIPLAKSVAEDYSGDVIYRLHPNTQNSWQKTYPRLVNSDLIVDDGTKSLYEQFSKSEIQIGTTSTALFEGLYFGLQTLILQTETQIYDLLTELDAVSTINNRESLIDLIYHNHSTPNMSKFFRPHPINNIERELRSITSN